MSLAIAIQGQPASFHDTAARQFFGDDISLICCDLPFSKVFDALEETAAFAVCAIENSLYGSINDVYDLLLKHKPWICGEVILPIEQCLIGMPGSSIDTISEVHSHPVALAQCDIFLTSHLPHAKKLEADDTAGSVAMIAKLHDPTKAAIASRQAAALYGMEVLAPAIETNHHNYTRFAVLSKRQSDNAQADKTSIVIEAPHKAGSLYAALGAFAHEGINLTLIISRPIIGKPGRYMFYIDFACGLYDLRSKRALAALQDHHSKVTILGSYKAAQFPSEISRLQGECSPSTNAILVR